MITNNYCSAPPPTTPPPTRPTQSPPSAVHLKEMHC